MIYDSIYAIIRKIIDTEVIMYTIEFYEDINGESELWNFLEDLRIKSATSKDARIQYNQIVFYIDLLSKSGTRLPRAC